MTKTGGPAFRGANKEITHYVNGVAQTQEVYSPGMTLRDYFAGQAVVETASWDFGNDWGKKGKRHPELAAKAAYSIADAMIAERERTNDQG